MASRQAPRVLQVAVYTPLKCLQSYWLRSSRSFSKARQDVFSRNLAGQHGTSSTILYRQFSSTAKKKAKNRIYTPVRRPDELSSYILSSTSSRTPLITLWTASWCPSCRMVSPLTNALISSGVGEAEGGVAFCEVEFDSSEIMDSELGMQYMITSIPTLFTFDRGEIMAQTRTTDVTKMKNQEWLKTWIEREAKRRGEGSSGGGGGGVLGSGLFGGLFGDRR